MVRPFLVVCALGAAACGPFQSTSHLLDAQAALDQARVANAEKLAPYEWTAANLYLHKAREEVGYSDYEHAIRYAQTAAKFASLAREHAVKTAKRDEPGHPP